MAKGLVFAAAAGLTLALSISAQAMPIGRADLGRDSLVTTVAQGCGPGWERNRWGECRPMRGPRYVDPRPRYVDPRPRYVDPRPRYVDPRPRVVVPGVMVAPRVVAPRPARCWVEPTPYGPRKVCR